jgi:hypothetical protein
MLSACNPSGDTVKPEPGVPLALDLLYLPDSEADPGDAVGAVPVAAGTKVWVSKVVDGRDKTNDIGFSEEGDNTPVVLGGGGQTPVDFVRSVVAKEMPVFGVPVAMKREEATHTLELQLLKFWVQEGGTYVGEVAVHATLRDGAGETLWDGSLTGVDKHWGKTFTVENFTNTFGSATQDVAKRVALQPDLRQALSTKSTMKPKPEAAAAPPAEG